MSMLNAGDLLVYQALRSKDDGVAGAKYLEIRRGTVLDLAVVGGCVLGGGVAGWGIANVLPKKLLGVPVAPAVTAAVAVTAGTLAPVRLSARAGLVAAGLAALGGSIIGR